MSNAGSTGDVPRPLTTRAQQLIEFLLATDFPGVVGELRSQVHFAVVVGDWLPCCATIEMTVDRERVPRASVAEPVAVGAHSRDGLPARDLNLHVCDGLLVELEIVHYEEEPGPQELPAPADWKPPRP